VLERGWSADLEYLTNCGERSACFLLSLLALVTCLYKLRRQKGSFLLVWGNSASMLMVLIIAISLLFSKALLQHYFNLRRKKALGRPSESDREAWMEGL